MRVPRLAMAPVPAGGQGGTCHFGSRWSVGGQGIGEYGSLMVVVPVVVVMSLCWVVTSSRLRLNTYGSVVVIACRMSSCGFI